MPNIAGVQQNILTELDSGVAQPVIEQAVPTATTVLRDSTGAIKPYFAVQFGDIQQGRSRSAVGPRGEDYVLPVYVQCIGPTAEIARGLQNKLLDVFLGVDFAYSGNVRKRPGGGMFVLNASNEAVEAYAFPASFGVTVQFE